MTQTQQIERTLELVASADAKQALIGRLADAFLIQWRIDKQIKREETQ